MGKERCMEVRRNEEGRVKKGEGKEKDGRRKI